MARVVGIYAIRNKKTQQIYVGKSVDVKDRFRRHKTKLKHDKHHNAYLQRSYNKYGNSAFEYLILETCKKNVLANKEQEWINKYHNKDAKILFNHEMDVLTNQGSSNPFFGHKHTQVTKKKISKARKGKYAGKQNPNYGKRHNVDVRKSMALRRAKKLTPEDVTSIRKKLAQDMKHKEIAKEFNVSRTIITRIKSGARYALVGEQP